MTILSTHPDCDNKILHLCANELVCAAPAPISLHWHNLTFTCVQCPVHVQCRKDDKVTARTLPWLSSCFTFVYKALILNFHIQWNQSEIMVDSVCSNWSDLTILLLKLGKSSYREWSSPAVNGRNEVFMHLLVAFPRNSVTQPSVLSFMSDTWKVLFYEELREADFPAVSQVKRPV